MDAVGSLTLIILGRSASKPQSSKASVYLCFAVPFFSIFEPCDLQSGNFPYIVAFAPKNLLGLGFVPTICWGRIWVYYHKGPTKDQLTCLTITALILCMAVFSVVSPSALSRGPQTGPQDVL